MEGTDLGPSGLFSYITLRVSSSTMLDMTRERVEYKINIQLVRKKEERKFFSSKQEHSLTGTGNDNSDQIDSFRTNHES